MQKKLFRYIGIIGALASLVIFIDDPSWPTPDKLLVFVTFVFMAFSQGWQAFKRLVPFVGILLVYESFRGLVPSLNKRVHYQLMIRADRWLFGGTLPTKTLQHWLYNGHVQWYDFLFYLAYMLHFILPISLAILVWKTREKHYWRYITTYLTVSFAGFVTFLFFPAAPPWLAAQNGMIEHITRVSSSVFFALGIHNFPSVYNRISPNPVAAMPSLHAAYGVLFVIFVYKLYGKRWGLAAALYPLLIFFGTVYMGEHYVVDEVAGALYAIGGYAVVSWYFNRCAVKALAVSKLSLKPAPSRKPKNKVNQALRK
jgi:membrane-associated phospholipid phosphatase